MGLNRRRVSSGKSKALIFKPKRSYEVELELNIFGSAIVLVDQ